MVFRYAHWYRTRDSGSLPAASSSGSRATLISVEEKGGKRFRKIFEIIATERDVPGSLLPLLEERARESLRAKNYYAAKTWETIERLLLSRSEAAYLDEGHSRFMEVISGDAGSRGGTPPERTEVADPEFLVPFEDSGMRRKAAIVLIELLGREKSEPDFLDLLEEVRKMIPNLISRKEFALLDIVLGMLSSIHGKAPESTHALGSILLSEGLLFSSKPEKETALSIMKEGRGTEFEPRLFDSFLDLLK